MNTDTPCALIASCSSLKPEQLVKEILCKDVLPEASSVYNGIQGYPWHIDTKYYTADILVSTAHSKTIGDKQFADRVHAFLLLFDANESEGLDRAKAWLPFVKEFEPPVQLLIAESFSPASVISRHKALSWCLEEGFELVELHPQPLSGDEDSEHDDDFVETVGIARVIEAMEAHMWPNLQMKEKPDVRGTYFKQLMAEEATRLKDVNTLSSPSSDIIDTSEPSSEPPVSAASPSDAVSTTVAHADSTGSGDNKSQYSTTKTTSEPVLATTTIISEDGRTDNPDSGLPQTNFEDMFGQLKDMKDRAANMPEAERKLFAEQIVSQFWRAIGGDEDELEGMDSD